VKIATYLKDGVATVGVVDERAGTVSAVTSLPTGTSLLDIIRLGDALDLEVVAASPVTDRLEDVTFLAAIPVPAREIFCVGKNYAEHAHEFSDSGSDSDDPDAIPSVPIIFTKSAQTVIGTGDVIDPHTRITSQLDYEGEIAVIIGRGGVDISAANAMDHVWGYTIVNDVTARDRQKDHKQWLLGKSLDTHCPMGPWVATADEIDITDLHLTCRVNGETRQDASTKDFIFDVPTVIEALSAGLTLHPGDIIATGTPVGVGIGMKPPRFLVAGDIVEVAADGLGTLTNTIGH